MSPAQPHLRRRRMLVSGICLALMAGAISVVAAAPAVATARPIASIGRGQSIGYHATAASLQTTTAARVPLTLTVQSDGNMVLYVGKQPRYQTATHAAHAVLRLQTDGNLVLYSGSRVLKNWKLHSAWRLTLQSDGNLVVYGTSNGRPLWSTGPKAPVAKPAPVSPQISIANGLLSMLNGERKAHGLTALVMNRDLITSANRHNLTMAAYNSMSHQLPGEQFFAVRILQAGFNYLYAGENIGWNSVKTLAGAQALESLMYNEKAPNDGHRQNILSRNYNYVGIDIYFDAAHNKMWLTEDFGRPS